MIFKKIENETCGTTAQISSFAKKGNVSECMVMMHVRADQFTYSEQLHTLLVSFDELRQNGLLDYKPVFMRFFLSDAANQIELIDAELAKIQECAVSIVEQAPLDGSKIALFAYLRTNVDVKVLPNGMYAVNDGAYTHYWACVVTHNKASVECQMRSLFDEYAKQLTEQGCNMEANAIRTWIFVHNIDVNYPDIVKARNEMFATQNLTDKTHFITSTCVQGKNADSKVFVQLDTYSVKGLKKEQIQYLYAPTHMNPTYEYGVSFERGTCVHYNDRRHVFVSGTASINNKGEVMYCGDICKQTLRILENVEVLLKEAECDLSDIAQMIVYLRDIADYTVVNNIFAERLPDIPIVFLHAPICRSTWLIETECIAIK